MLVKKSELSRMAIELERGSVRSPLFWWMVQHWKKQAEPGPRPKVDWVLQCARFTRLEVHDATGKPPSPGVAKRTWRKAKAYLQEQAAAAAVPVAPKPAAHAPWGRSPVTGRPLPLT